jgi:hypothetical protein
MLVLLEEIAVIKFCINIMDMTRKKKILYVFFYMQCSLIRVSYWDSSYASCKCFFLHSIHISSIFNLNFGLSGIEIRNVVFQAARSGGDEG